MELPTDVEEILSDDYEEGEILDGDNLYDDVSSLEEFSSSEDIERSQLKHNQSQTEKQNSVCNETVKQIAKHRKKDHKCKENSVCRKERKGKHCYARIRKAKSSVKSKPITAAIPLNSVERAFPRKLDVGLVVKHLKSRPTSPYKSRPDLPKVLHRYDHKVSLNTIERAFPRNLDVGPVTKQLKSRPTSPYKSRPDPPKVLHRYYHKDYHEKENRHNNKRYWSTPLRSKLKPTEKPIHHNRNKINKDNHYSKSRHQTVPSGDLGDNYSKTSLLKRLVGSGSSGVKPIKENEPSAVFPKTEEISHQDNLETDEVVEQICKTEETDKAVTENGTDVICNSIKEEGTTNESQQAQPLTGPPKKIELKWIRSMKEDKDELHLRVEALRSAWVKKFNDRKKRGLIHMKKSDNVDDFLEEFAFNSDIEEEKNEDIDTPKISRESAEVNSFPHFNATDISGDILKPEDMVIVNEKPSEEPIICETAVTASEGNSSIFVGPVFFSSEHYPQNTSISTVPNSNRTNTNIAGINTPDLVSSEGKVFSENVSAHNSFQNSGKSRPRRKWRKKRKSKGSLIDTTNNAANISAELDEDVLRELALLSLKSKNRITNSIKSEEKNKNIDKDVTPLSNEQESKPIAKSCELENTGTTSVDNWEDDLDEDILRAKLLSSLTKQVSEESAKLERATASVQKLFQKDSLISSKVAKPTVNLGKLPITKKLIIKKLDRRKLRNSVTKKIWKHGSVGIRKLRLEPNITVNRFSKPTVFKKIDKVVQGQLISASSNLRPIPQVPQMIITLDDSDSSSDIETSNSESLSNLPKSEAVSSDIEAKLDLLLREAELNSQLEKGVLDQSIIKTDDREEKRKESKRDKIKTPTSTSSSSSPNSIPTPQALKHLPAWQQEEYKRLKKKIAEKEKVLQVTRSKILEPTKDINANNSVLSEEKASVISNTSPTSILPLPVTGSLSGEQSAISSLIGSDKIVTKDVTDNQTSIDHELNLEVVQNNRAEVRETSKHGSAEENKVKKSLPHLVSCSIMEEISLMNDVVNDFEKNNSEYMDLKDKIARLKRILKATESKMTVKKQEMFQIRDTITEKERLISSKIATFLMTSSAHHEKLKPPSRDMELVKLKYKEVSLRAQFLFHDFLSEKVQGKNVKKAADSIPNPESKVKEILPVGVKRNLDSKDTAQFKKQIIAIDSKALKNVLPADKAKEHMEAPLKRNFSAKEREREEWDPNTPVCHYDLNGICRDEECQYQHFKTV